MLDKLLILYVETYNGGKQLWFAFLEDELDYSPWRPWDHLRLWEE